MKFILSLLLISSISFAGEVKYLEQGDPAPYNGYLFTITKELEVRLLNEKLPVLEKKIQLQEDIAQIMEARIKNDKEYISSLEKKQDFQSLKELGYFVLGAVLTGFIAANVGH